MHESNFSQSSWVTSETPLMHLTWIKESVCLFRKKKRPWHIMQKTSESDLARPSCFLSRASFWKNKGKIWESKVPTPNNRGRLTSVHHASQEIFGATFRYAAQKSKQYPRPGSLREKFRESAGWLHLPSWSFSRAPAADSPTASNRNHNRLKAFLDDFRWLAESIALVNCNK